VIATAALLATAAESTTVAGLDVWTSLKLVPSYVAVSAPDPTGSTGPEDTGGDGPLPGTAAGSSGGKTASVGVVPVELLSRVVVVVVPSDPLEPVDVPLAPVELETVS
jgi:hypothetical protein